MNKHIPGLDLLRATAIMLVVFNHGINFFVERQSVSPYLCSTGLIGVDLFFVLSGFLIGGILIHLGDRFKEPRMAAGFWLNRAMRTLPNYYLFVAINLALYQLVFRYRWNFEPHFLLKSLVFAQNFSHRPGSFFGESWSLCVEEWFYLLFPLGVFLCLLLRMRFAAAYWTMVGVMMAVPLISRMEMGRPEFWELDVGMVVIRKLDAIAWGLATVGLVRGFGPVPARLRLWLLFAGIGILFECYVFIVRVPLEPSLFARTLLPVVIPMGYAMMMPWAAGCMSLGRGAFESGVAALARWSYSLYLTNYMASSLMDIYLIRVRSAWLLGILFLAITIGLSAAIYRWFEAPILRRRTRIPICRETSAARAGLVKTPAPGPT